MSTIQPTDLDNLDDSAGNLMAVVRELSSANKQDESLVPLGKASFRRADGLEVESEIAWFAYLGDMMIRFVFDTPTMFVDASWQDLRRFDLTPESALELAVANVRRVYGPPGIVAWSRVWEVKGKSPDLDSSFFLDKAFWNELAEQCGCGIVASVAKRGGLLFAPLSDVDAVEGMRRSVAYLHASSERLRISSALYLFEDGRWSVFQAPVGKRQLS